MPVVKGNGYGFGRSVLGRMAEDLLASQRQIDTTPAIAVGTVHELAGLPSRLRPVVLTPPGAPANHRWQASPNRPIVTIGDPAHISALDGWRGDVLVKLASSMRRFGVAPRELDDFERTARVAGLKVVGYSIHLPLAGEDLDRVAEVERWVTALDNRRTTIDRPSDVWVSHLGPEAHAGLCRDSPTDGSRSGSVRPCGTATNRCSTSPPMSSTSTPCPPGQLPATTARGSSPTAPS